MAARCLGEIGLFVRSVDELTTQPRPSFGSGRHPGVLSNDSDPDAAYTLRASFASGPRKAKKFALNPDGSFTYTVSDGNGGTDTATVNIKIKGVKDRTEQREADPGPGRRSGSGPFPCP